VVRLVEHLRRQTQDTDAPILRTCLLGMAIPAMVDTGLVAMTEYAVAFTHRMSFINVLRTPLLRAAKQHPATTWRFISAVNTHEAFLQSLPSHPGITVLTLNRPQAKNAISLQMLKVPCINLPCPYPRIPLPTCDDDDRRNSRTAWTPCASTTLSAYSS
jgi:hypothetical protein